MMMSQDLAFNASYDAIMHPIIMITISYNKITWKEIGEEYYLNHGRDPLLLLFSFLHLFSDMGFFSTSLVIFILELRTIYFLIPIFLTSIELDLSHVPFLFLRTKFPIFSSSPCHNIWFIFYHLIPHQF